MSQAPEPGGFFPRPYCISVKKGVCGEKADKLRLVCRAGPICLSEGKECFSGERIIDKWGWTGCGL